MYHYDPLYTDSGDLRAARDRCTRSGVYSGMRGLPSTTILRTSSTPLGCTQGVVHYVVVTGAFAENGDFVHSCCSSTAVNSPLGRSARSREVGRRGVRQPSCVRKQCKPYGLECTSGFQKREQTNTVALYTTQQSEITVAPGTKAFGGR